MTSKITGKHGSMYDPKVTRPEAWCPKKESLSGDTVISRERLKRYFVFGAN